MFAHFRNLEALSVWHDDVSLGQKLFPFADILKQPDIILAASRVKLYVVSRLRLFLHLHAVGFKQSLDPEETLGLYCPVILGVLLAECAGDREQK